MATIEELANYKLEQSPTVKKLINSFYNSELYNEIKDTKWIYICSLPFNIDNIKYNLENNIFGDQRYAIISCRYILSYLLKGLGDIFISINDKIEFTSFILSFDNVYIMVVDDEYCDEKSLLSDPICVVELAIAKYKSLIPLDYNDDPLINIVSYSKYIIGSKDIDISDVILSKELIDNKIYRPNVYDFEFGYFNPLVSTFLDDHMVTILRKQTNIVYIYSNLPFAIAEKKISLQKYLEFFKINGNYNILEDFFNKYIGNEFEPKYLKWAKIENKKDYLSTQYNDKGDKELYIFEPFEEVKKYTKKLNNYYANLSKDNKNYNRKITPKEKVEFLHYILSFSRFIVLVDNLSDEYNKFDYNNGFLKDRDLFSLKGIMSFYR